MKRLLIIAYHFPPLAGSSGIQRTLRFVQHLPKFDWEPIVLSADPRAYERTSEDLMKDIPEGVVVRRAFALDTARHLSIAGRYIGAMARPDRWVSWKIGAVREGMRMIREFKPQAIWSTYPIATAHLIGAELQRRSGLPWIADFRDPMAQDGYPADPLVWQSYKSIEERTLSTASYSTFTTPGAAQTYRSRYPNSAERIVVLENGYDEETFAEVESIGPLNQKIHPKAVTLLHSGIVYPEERDPTQFFAALGQLKTSGKIQAGTLKIRFRASVHDDLLNSLAKKYDVAEFIDCQPPIPYREALAEMLNADGLLVMQASNCNEQIPAKIYEYLRARRPIFALTDPLGDTAATLRNAGASDMARLDSSSEICDVLPAFIDAIRRAKGASSLPLTPAIEQASRVGRTAQLAKLLDSITAR
ncbi:glycosyltransferase [Dechloromonas denitrificans]|uniref:glycosyltransferase n=1 Tax=Dechloromonas denitrificans TaxID=281362 RepID=UPI001CF88E0D|nr:glycosyltransferase [Dechloromonas denitrificans]UCV01941.1 glycosyltransferase [Dechloromonas denitrificans]UCV06275.1 glycosyltransferase [Dechloromonas denitrificans]